MRHGWLFCDDIEALFRASHARCEIRAGLLLNPVADALVHASSGVCGSSSQHRWPRLRQVCQIHAGWLRGQLRNRPHQGQMPGEPAGPVQPAAVPRPCAFNAAPLRPGISSQTYDGCSTAAAWQLLLGRTPGPAGNKAHSIPLASEIRPLDIRFTWARCTCSDQWCTMPSN